MVDNNRLLYSANICRPTCTCLKCLNNIRFEKFNVTRQARFPKYSDNASRVLSFTLWPRQMKQTCEEMVDAGFFYSGINDNCICYQCGLEIRNWEVQDTAWGEHRRWLQDARLRCAYMDLVKGPQFYDEKEPAQTAEAPPSPQEDEELLLPPSPSEEMTCDDTLIPSSSAEEMTCDDTLKQDEEPSTNMTSTDCLICLSTKINIVFLPCAHTVCCALCGLQLKRCPICRDEVADYFHVYLP
jgi:hypothetical protein